MSELFMFCTTTFTLVAAYCLYSMKAEISILSSKITSLEYRAKVLESELQRLKNRGDAPCRDGD